MTPVAIGLGEGGEFYRPMAVAIIGGTITSTLLTLLVVPTFYDSIEISRDRAFAKFRRRARTLEPLLRVRRHARRGAPHAAPGALSLSPCEEAFHAGERADCPGRDAGGGEHPGRRLTAAMRRAAHCREAAAGFERAGIDRVRGRGCKSPR